MRPSYQERRGFWNEAIALHGSVTLKVLPSILLCGVISILMCVAATLSESYFGDSITLDISPFGFAGAVLGILLVIRLNAGYDRWWEARTLWGGIVNQSRNLAISGLAYGPRDPKWREQFIAMIATFPYSARDRLREGPNSKKVIEQLALDETQMLDITAHLPSKISWRIGLLMQEARVNWGLDGFAFLQIDQQRMQLIDHLGACERILATPLPRIYSITIRRFILLFLFILPLALWQHLDSILPIPPLTMLIAYPLLSLDQIGVELENPFSLKSLSHLPLDEISENTERNILDLLADSAKNEQTG